MGTKNNPGRFDCYANAEPDEPMFVLLGRDPSAWFLVGLWAALRNDMEDGDSEQAAEARECMRVMREFAASRGKDVTEVLQTFARETNKFIEAAGKFEVATDGKGEQ